jgi:hypothetical protein
VNRRQQQEAQPLPHLFQRVTPALLAFAAAVPIAAEHQISRMPMAGKSQVTPASRQ